jgi:hypothetical protein
VESFNRSLDRDYLEYIRILNRRTARGEPVFTREDVLDAALRSQTMGEPADGIASWLSPSARRELLARYDAGNAAIARTFAIGSEGRLFQENLPMGDQSWRPYAGLTAERATAISMAVHEAALARHTCGRPDASQLPVLAKSQTD